LSFYTNTSRDLFTSEKKRK